MTETKQAYSMANAHEEDIDHSFNCYMAVKEAKADAKNNIQVVASVYDSMNNLCSALERLDNLEEIIFNKEKENG